MKLLMSQVGAWVIEGAFCGPASRGVFTAGSGTHGPGFFGFYRGSTRGHTAMEKSEVTRSGRDFTCRAQHLYICPRTDTLSISNATVALQ